MGYPLTFWDDRYLQAAIVLILSLIGIIANTVILSSKLVTNKRAVVSLVIASYTFLLPNFVVYLPCALSGCHFYSPLLLNLLSTPDTIGYYTYQLCLTHLSLERVLVFYSDQNARKIQKLLIHITVGIWIYVCTQVVVEWFFNCRKSFNPEFLFLYFDAKGEGVIFLDIHKGISYGAPLTMILCYSAVFIRLRIMHSNMSSKKVWSELFLVFQYLFVCICSWLACFCFYYLHQLQETFQSNLSLLPTVISILSLTSHAYVFLLTNQRLRRAILRCIVRLCQLKMRTPVSDAMNTVINLPQKSSIPVAQA